VRERKGEWGRGGERKGKDREVGGGREREDKEKKGME
jgi:hypothetical protein